MSDIAEWLRVQGVIEAEAARSQAFYAASSEIERLRGEIVVLKESLNKANAKNSQILQRLHNAKMKGYVDG